MSPFPKVHGNFYSLQKKMCIFTDFQHRFASCISTGWDNRDRKHHYIQKQWPKRESLIPGEKNAVNTPFVSIEKVYLPPQHIKLGLIKNFISSRQ
jgi:hypothetical protein